MQRTAASLEATASVWPGDVVLCRRAEIAGRVFIGRRNSCAVRTTPEQRKRLEKRRSVKGDRDLLYCVHPGRRRQCYLVRRPELLREIDARKSPSTGEKTP